MFVHGYSDHINRYYELFPTLAGRGIAVYGFDQRGWGRSVSQPSERGLTGPTTTVIADIAAFARPQLPTSPADPPLFMMGHSMGGGEVLTLACDPAYEDLVAGVRGWLLEGPFIGFSAEEQPSKLKVVAGRLAGKLLPRFQLVNRLPPENLVRVPEVIQSLRDDPLCHDTGTLEGLGGMLDRTAALDGHTAKLSKKVQNLWLGHGTLDKGTSFDASKRWFDAMTGGVKDRTFKAYEGYFHQLHADYGKEVFYQDVGDWILARCDSGTSKATPATPATAAASETAKSAEIATEDTSGAKL